MKTFSAVILTLVLLAGSFLLGRVTKPVPIPERHIDTVLLRDTIRDTVRIPRISYYARIDTVFLRIPGDTVRVEVEVPIERKVYKTDDYRATIEGFRPSLVDMEVYRKNEYITRTETIRVPVKRRWGIGIQAGYGYNFDRFYPYVGIGLQYSIISW